MISIPQSVDTGGGGLRFLRTVSEAVVIIAFLQGELESSRFGADIRKALVDLDLPARLITAPQVDDPVEAGQRSGVLAVARGWGTDARLFEGFPKEVKWVEAELDPTDLEDLRYIDYSYWNDSGGTRSPRDGARRAREGVAPFGIPFHVEDLVGAIQEHGGWPFPPPILMTDAENSKFVILEGHVRLTAFMDKKIEPQPLMALVGSSPDIRRWSLYGG